LLAACASTTPPVSAPAGDGRTSQITVLYDAFGKPSSMQKDWGYAALIEYGGKRILCDTGNNGDTLAQNARAKGIDLSKLDFVVMSHRHGDHMGGLAYLLSVNPKVKIFAPKEGFGVYGGDLPSASIVRTPRCHPSTVLRRRAPRRDAVRRRPARRQFPARRQERRDRNPASI
jgi:7,8-dihydropterin-6-yl-methyl-4-(beta-D-ribofuranosyl)aminobenzene 5'-phosphate synthase